jgi:hypothetical protein
MDALTLEIIKITLQGVTSTCIAGSFIYGAVQFRNYKRAQHVANFIQLVKMQMDLRKMRVDSPDLARVFRNDVKDLPTDKEIREYFFVLMQLSVFEIAWYSHKHGQLTDDYFQSWKTRMAEIESEPSFQRMFNNPAMKILHDDFQAYIEKNLANLKAQEKMDSRTGTTIPRR